MAFAGEVYNVGGPEALSVRALAARLAALLGIDPVPAFTGTNRTGDAECWLADSSKLQSLRYHRAMSVEDGLRETIGWVRSEEEPTGSPKA